MTARKIHFEVESAAFCNATPREGAAPLELTTGADEVTCLLCQALIADRDADATIARLTHDNEVKMDLAGHTGDLHRSIADRHGLDVTIVRDAFAAGYLKR